MSDPRAVAEPVRTPRRPAVLLFADPDTKPAGEAATLARRLAALGCPPRSPTDPACGADDGPRLAIGCGPGAAAALDGAAAAGADLVVAFAPRGNRAAASPAPPAPVPTLLVVDLLDRPGRRRARKAHGRDRPVLLRLAGLGPAGVEHLDAIGGLAAILAVAGDGRPSPAALAGLARTLRRLHRAGRGRSPAYLSRIADWAAARGRRRAFRLAAERIADLAPGPPRLARLLGQARTLGDAASLARLIAVAGRDHPTAPQLQPFLAAGGDPAVRILHDAGRSIIRYVESDPDCRRPLFVTFTGFEGDRSPRPGFGETLLRKLGCNCVAVKSVNRNNFTDLSVDDLAGAVGPIARRHPAVITYGHSGGGYAALYFSGAVGADLALAVSPRNSRDPRYRHAKVVIPPEWTDGHGRLRDVAGAATTKLVVLDPSDVQDLAYFRGEIADLPGLVTVRLPFGGHPCTEHMIRTGALKPMIEDLVEGRRAPADAAGLAAAIAAAHRTGRGASTVYLTVMARRLGQRRKLASLKAVLARVDLERLAESQLYRLMLACHAAGLKQESAGIRAVGAVRFPESRRLAHPPRHRAVAAGLDLVGTLAARLGLRRRAARADDEDDG